MAAPVCHAFVRLCFSTAWPCCVPPYAGFTRGPGLLMCFFSANVRSQQSIAHCVMIPAKRPSEYSMTFAGGYTSERRLRKISQKQKPIGLRALVSLRILTNGLTKPCWVASFLVYAVSAAQRSYRVPTTIFFWHSRHHEQSLAIEFPAIRLDDASTPPAEPHRFVSSRSTIGGGGGGCHNFVPVLGGDDTKIAPPGDLFDQPHCEMSWIRGKLADHAGDHAALSPEGVVW